MVLWYYGTAGVCRSLYLAGKATDNKWYFDTARAGFKAILNRHTEEWKLDGATFCHGFSGLLQIANRILKDTEELFYVNLINKITEEIVKLKNDQNPFIFKDSEGKII